MNGTLIATIFFVTIFLASIMVYLYIAIVMSKKRSAHDQGKLLFLYNSKNRTIRLDNSPLNKAINKYIYQDTYKSVSGGYTWNDFTALSDQFANTNGASAIRSLINTLNTDQKNSQIDFKVSNFGWAKKKTFEFTITGVKLEREDIFALILKWEPVIDINYKEASIPETPLTEIANRGYPAVGFVAFNANIKVKNAQYKFINAYINLNNHKPVTYFIKRNTVIIVVEGRKLSSVNKKIRKIKTLVKTKGLDISLSHFYNATATVQIQNASSVKKISKVFSLIEYLLYLSITHKKPFMSIKSSQYNVEESVEFIESSYEFRSALKTGNFKPETLSVRKRSTNRHIINYIRPVVNGVPNKVVDKILLNKTYKTYLVDSYANTVIKGKGSKGVLVDVNDYWLIESVSSFENKRAIYIINVNSWTDSTKLTAIVRVLKEQGFYFALRIRKFNEEISSLMTNIEPQFIVIDESLAQNPYDSDAYISILSINKLADENGIKVIFENPIDYYDHMREEQIGLVYYYSFDKS